MPRKQPHQGSTDHSSPQPSSLPRLLPGCSGSLQSSARPHLLKQPLLPLRHIAAQLVDAKNARNRNACQEGGHPRTQERRHAAFALPLLARGAAACRCRLPPPLAGKGAGHRAGSSYGCPGAYRPNCEPVEGSVERRERQGRAWRAGRGRGSQQQVQMQRWSPQTALQANWARVAAAGKDSTRMEGPGRAIGSCGNSSCTTECDRNSSVPSPRPLLPSGLTQAAAASSAPLDPSTQLAHLNRRLTACEHGGRRARRHRRRRRRRRQPGADGAAAAPGRAAHVCGVPRLCCERGARAGDAGRHSRHRSPAAGGRGRAPQAR